MGHPVLLSVVRLTIIISIIHHMISPSSYCRLSLSSRVPSLFTCALLSRASTINECTGTAEMAEQYVGTL